MAFSSMKKLLMQPRRLLVFLRCHWERADSPTWIIIFLVRISDNICLELVGH